MVIDPPEIRRLLPKQEVMGISGHHQTCDHPETDIPLAVQAFTLSYISIGLLLYYTGELLAEGSLSYILSLYYDSFGIDCHVISGFYL